MAFIMQRRIALTMLACGVAVFFLALYGVFGSTSPALAIVGLSGVVGGLVGLLFSLRASALSKPNVITLVLILFGVALHAYEQTRLSSSFSVGLLL
jgi:hypothetical protein